MFKIINAPAGRYEFRFPDIIGAYTTPNNSICEYDGETTSIITAEYDDYERPINLEPGLTDLTLSVKYSDDNGFSYKDATTDLLNKIKFIEYDFTSDVSKMAAIIQDSSNVILRSCRSPITTDEFNTIFTNIASGYYYILKIANISGYSMHDQVIYKKLPRDQSYELEIKFIKTTTTTASKICFEVQMTNNSIIETSLDPFTLDLTTGYSKDVVEYDDTYEKTITFNGEIITNTSNNKKVFLSNIYSVNALFGVTELGWIKPKSTNVTYSGNGHSTSITILSNPRDCTTRIERRIIGEEEIIVVQILDYKIVSQS
jgi:hypothetical protein